MATPPPAAPGGGAETLGAAAEAQAVVAAKRARKRSRYLSGDYDTTILDAILDDDIAASPREGEDAAALLLRLQEANLAAADLLAALLRSAASPCDDCVSPGPGSVDAGVLLSFFGLHRASLLATKCEDTSTTTDHQHSKDADVASGHGHGLPNPCGPMAVAVDESAGQKQGDAISMGHASYAAPRNGPANAAGAQDAGPKKRNRVTFALDGCTAATDCSAQPAAAGGSAMAHASYGQHNGPANAPAAGPKKRRRRKKKVASALDTPSATAAAGRSAQPATTTGGGAHSAPPKKKARNGSGHGPRHSGKPVALILEFSQERSVRPPSKEALLSTFRGFGSLNEPETDIGARRARLVFQSSAAAEAAYSCAHTLGTFSARRLQYLRPPPPAPKIPLADVRKNLEKMIASLTAPSMLGRDGALDLTGQMLRLMAKVDKNLNTAGVPGPSSATAARRH